MLYLQYTGYSSNRRHLCLMTMYVGPYLQIILNTNEYDITDLTNNYLTSDNITSSSRGLVCYALKHKVTFYSWLLPAFSNAKQI